MSIQQVIDQIRKVIRLTSVPTWVAKVPKQFGSARAGTLKAAAWKTVFSIYLPIALITLWSSESSFQPSDLSFETSSLGDSTYSSDLLRNTMYLAQAVGLAYKRRASVANSSAYKDHIANYLQEIERLFPHSPSRPNHHFLFHLGDFLLSFGPMHGWHCFPFERLIGYLQRLPSSHIVGKYP